MAKTVGILTGGGDVPGLNPAMKMVVLNALEDGYRVLGIRRGWMGLLHYDLDEPSTHEYYVNELDCIDVRKIDRNGGTFLHTSRTNPQKVKEKDIPDFLVNSDLGKNLENGTFDYTDHVLKVLDHLNIDILVTIGGDDTLSYSSRLTKEGFPTVGIPKTMDNDVPGTDYCIGYSTCVTRTISLTHALRTTAGSHERFLVIEVFGRYAGYTALLPTMAGAADRCVIPEYKFNVEKLCELLSEDRRSNPSHYSVALISEGAAFEGEDMIFESEETDMYGHKKLGGIGDRVSSVLRELSPKYNHGRWINVINQKLGYLVRCGDPDAIDSIVPMAYGNLALDLVMENKMGRMVCLRNGEYDHIPLETVISYKKRIDLDKYYDRERLRPLYKNFYQKPFLILTAD
ncbi:MAG TPA: phosphofructokinase [Acidobacteria bacterium]|nr:phosphofructokinase [Acidobacteriota bacterium]